MLAVDLLEFLGRLLVVVLGVEEKEALVVEPVGGLVGSVSSFLLKRSKLLARAQAQPSATQAPATRAKADASDAAYRQSLWQRHS